MATIKITDQTGLDIMGTAGDGSTVIKYLKQDLILHPLKDLKDFLGKPLNQISPVSFPISFSAAGTGQFALSASTLEVSVGAGVSVSELTGDDSLALLSRLAMDETGSPPTYLSFGLTGKVGVAAVAAVGPFTFGISAGSALTATAYRIVDPTEPFDRGLKETVGAFCIPDTVEDLVALDQETIYKFEGKGTLQFSAGAEYDFPINPLATLPLTSLSGPLKIVAGGSAALALSYTFTRDYQVTLAKAASGEIHIGLSLTNVNDIDTSLDLSIGFSAAVGGDDDVIAFLLNRISPNADAELKQLKDSLAPGEVRDIKAALQGAIDRSLKAALHLEFESTRSKGQLFTLQIDTSKLEVDGEAALSAALKGDFKALTGRPLTGVTMLHSSLHNALQRSHTLTLHLFGILNATSVSTFIKESKVNLIPETGEPFLSDTFTAKQIGLREVEFDSEKLREVMFNSVMITAAYSGTRAALLEPDLSCSLNFFLNEANADPSLLGQHLSALTILSAEASAQASSVIAAGVRHPGPLSVSYSLRLDAAASKQLFFKGDQPRNQVDYETAARQAFSVLLRSDPETRYRWNAINGPAEWTALKEIGGTRDGIALKLQLPPTQAMQVREDYLDIVWWAEAMSTFSEAIAGLDRRISAAGKLSADDSLFVEAKKKLDGAAEKAATGTDRNPRVPWSFLAMHSLLKIQPATVRFDSPYLTFRSSEVLPARVATAAAAEG